MSAYFSYVWFLPKYWPCISRALRHLRNTFQWHISQSLPGSQCHPRGAGHIHPLWKGLTEVLLNFPQTQNEHISKYIFIILYRNSTYAKVYDTYRFVLGGCLHWVRSKSAWFICTRIKHVLVYSWYGRFSSVPFSQHPHMEAHVFDPPVWAQGAPVGPWAMGPMGCWYTIPTARQTRTPHMCATNYAWCFVSAVGGCDEGPISDARRGQYQDPDTEALEKKRTYLCPSRIQHWNSSTNPGTIAQFCLI